VLLHSGSLVLPDRVLPDGHLHIHDGIIRALGQGQPTVPCPEPTCEPVDLHSAAVFPGFLDLHVHGGGGHGFADGVDALSTAIATHRREGTTGLIVSLITDTEQRMERAAASIDQLNGVAASTVLGMHLEGPFLSPRHLGIHPAAARQDPQPELVDRLDTASGGRLRIMTLAPELPGGIELIHRLADRGAIAAIGHSDADYQTACTAIDAGATLITHAFNAMRSLHHRDPGIVAAAMDRGTYVEAINDGVHLHDATMRLLHAAVSDKLILVTDAMPAAAAPDGVYRFAGQRVSVHQGRSRLLLDDGTLGAVAGSTLTMATAVKRAITEIGLTWPQAAIAASTNPAQLLHIDDQRGSIAPGLAADLTILDHDLDVAAVLQDGTWIDTRRP
jgi:N-acetylglucosamine-6-phosphate deacetylase